MIKICIIEDEPEIRKLLRMIVERQEGFQVVSEAGDFAAAVSDFAKYRPENHPYRQKRSGRYHGFCRLPLLWHLAYAQNRCALCMLRALVFPARQTGYYRGLCLPQ